MTNYLGMNRIEKPLHQLQTEAEGQSVVRFPSEVIPRYLMRSPVSGVDDKLMVAFLLTLMYIAKQ